MSSHMHDGHRKRMRDRFLQHGIECFQEHEMLEMLLFYAIPRVNTNELAHRLIDRFGSLYGVVTADIALLREVKGVTENAAVLLKMLPAFYQICSSDPTQRISMLHHDGSRSYFERIYRYETEEVLRVACLDDALCLKSCVKLNNGCFSHVEASVQEIVRCCVLEECRFMILVHNHPGQSGKASPQDIIATNALFQRLKAVSIDMIDHVIVGTDGAISMRQMGTFHFENVGMI